MVDEQVQKTCKGDDNEKNINYSKFVEIHKRCQAASRKGSSLKPGATMVPQVKGMGAIVDPSMAHLL